MINISGHIFLPAQISANDENKNKNPNWKFDLERLKSFIIHLWKN